MISWRWRAGEPYRHREFMRSNSRCRTTVLHASNSPGSWPVERRAKTGWFQEQVLIFNALLAGSVFKMYFVDVLSAGFQILRKYACLKRSNTAKNIRNS